MSYVPQRPGVVIAAGVLLLTYGSIGLASAFCGGGAMLMQQAFQPPAGPGEEAIFFAPVDPEVAKEVPSAAAVETTVFLVNLLLSVALIAIGIGILQLRPMARILAMIVGVVDVFVTLAHTAYSLILLFPVQNRLLDEEAKNLPPELPQNLFDMIKGAMWGGAVFTLAFTLVIWITVLFMLNSKAARAAFAEVIEPTEPPRRQDQRSRYDDDDDDALPPLASSGDTGITERPR